MYKKIHRSLISIKLYSAEFKNLTKKYLVIISEYKTGKLSLHRRTKRTKAERKRVVPLRLYGNISTACSPRGNHNPRRRTA